MKETQTKTHKGYIVLSDRGVPIYPTLATSRKLAIEKLTDLYGYPNTRMWDDYKDMGYSVQVCELVVPAIKR